LPKRVTRAVDAKVSVGRPPEAASCCSRGEKHPIARATPINRGRLGLLLWHPDRWVNPSHVAPARTRRNGCRCHHAGCKADPARRRVACADRCPALKRPGAAAAVPDVRMRAALPAYQGR
jgi:hypothetical protein